MTGLLILPLLAAAAPLNAQPDALRSGLARISELGCFQCHPGVEGVPSRQGPVLTGAGAQFRDDHSPRFRMQPSDLESLQRLLAASPYAGPAAAPGSAENGSRVFQRVGCAGCHDKTLRVRGYAPGRLAAFLLNPLAVRPSGRMPRLPITPQEAADLAAHLQPDAPPPAPRGDQSGAKLFVSAGCANCHALGDLRPGVKAPALTSAARGCMAAAPPSHVPDYRLDATQRAEVTAALRALEAGHRVSAAESVAIRLQTLGCLRCHTRDGQGGPGAANTDAFTELEDTDMGDEGRLPPSLTAVGYKLTPEALRAALRGDTHVHPRMAVRMPDYGPAIAAELSEKLAEVDIPANVTPVERVGRNNFGRQLAGVKGLGCVNCHAMRGRKSLGIGASDLALTPKRVRVEWFRDFLMDPARFHPGTRMPSFWPKGVAVAKNILRGDVGRQIDSLWVYLLEIEQGRLPEGMEDKGAFELKPGKEPIVLRAFMKVAGTHAVATGYPEGVHTAFDSNRIHWALAWRGRFLDAEGVWEDRFNPPLSPLGSDVLALPEGVSFSVSEDRWPEPNEYRFGGYRLDARGTPSFLYSYAGTSFTDRLTPNGTGLIRTIEVTGNRPLWFRAAAGAAIVRDGDAYVVDGKIRIRLKTEGRIRGRDGRTELIVAIPAGAATVTEEIAW